MGFLENLGAGLGDVLDEFLVSLKDSLSNTLKADEIVKTIKEVDEEFVSILSSFGGARELSYAIKSNITGAFTDVKLLGGSLGDIARIQKDTIDSLNKAVIINSEYFDDMYATAKVTDQYASTLVFNFDKVGASIYDIKDTMQETVNISRSMGLDATEVSSRMVSNLEKMNMYGFERGVQGLSMMAAKSAMFKLDMSSTFGLADKLINPEQAIEFSSRLQALGIQSELVDPFRAMDLATNDVEELQNQIIGLTKGMTFFNEETGKVEILKERRGVMRELATAAGMSAQQFAELTIQSATAQKKLSEIKLPELSMTEENKMMVANLAQLKEGNQGKGYYVQIETKDAQGKTKMEEKLVSKLDANDLQQLQEQYANPKSMEDLAKDQITIFEGMANSLEAIERGFAMGIAGSKAGVGIEQTLLASNELVLEPIAKLLDSKAARNMVDDNLNNLSTIFGDIQKGANEFDTTFDGLSSILNTNMQALVDGVGRYAVELDEGYNKVKKYSVIGSVPDLDKTTDKTNKPLQPPVVIKDGLVRGEDNSYQVHVIPSSSDEGLFMEQNNLSKILGGDTVIGKIEGMFKNLSIDTKIDEIKNNNIPLSNGLNILREKLSNFYGTQNESDDNINITDLNESVSKIINNNDGNSELLSAQRQDFNKIFENISNTNLKINGLETLTNESAINNLMSINQLNNREDNAPTNLQNYTPKIEIQNVTNNDSQMQDIMTNYMKMNESKKPEEVVNKMMFEKIEGKFTFDFNFNGVQGITQEQFTQLIQNNPSFTENIINAINKKMNDYGLKNSPKNTNTQYLGQ
jgi:hypothetical protein